MMVVFVLVMIMVYMWIGIRTGNNPRLRKWPLKRYGFWVLGMSSILVALLLHTVAHSHFTVHMVVHLLVGMLAPLLLVLAAPVTLFLRALPVKYARIVTGFLRSQPIQLLTHPAVAALLNFGGLWILYRTSIFEWMHMSSLVSILVHIHVFLAGFVFTSSVLYIDPAPHRSSFRLRAIIMLLGFTAHAILAKLIYAESLPGVALADARNGALLMYYGGDLVDAVLISIFCFFWYRQSSFNKRFHKSARAV